ncbi:MAG: CaiB/BaiF CoA transferase family protein [Saprospiraceae bacterium]
MNLLQDITILDFTRLLPGPLATHLLSQMGAKVIKIEHPKRMDYVRWQGPQIEGESVLFRMLNHRKECQTISYDCLEGRKEILALAKEADVIIEQFRPDVMAKWNLSFEDFKAVNPKLVYVSLTGYGQAGNMSQEAGHDINYMAYSGLLSLNKDENGKPIVPGFQVADIAGAYMAVNAVLAGVISSLKRGTGKHLDVSLTDSIAPFLTIPISLVWSEMKHDMFNIINGKTLVNYTVYQCECKKWIAVGALELKFWNNICDVLEKPNWKRDSQMELSIYQFPKKEVEALFLSQKREDWLSLFQEKDVCVSPVLEMEEVENFILQKDRKTFGQHQTEKGTNFKDISLPIKEKRNPSDF